MNMKRFRAIVFDHDDTLYPERAYVHSGFQAVADWVEAHLDISRDDAFREFWQLFFAGHRGNIFDLWLSSHGIKPEAWVPQMVKVYRDHDPRIKPYPDALELIPRLRQRYRLGLVTDGHVHVQQRKVEALGLAFHFDAIVFSAALGEGAGKPSTLPFKEVLERLKVSGHKAVYVGDNPQKDFLGARAVGMWTVRVRRPDGLYSHLTPPSEEYTPHIEITSLCDLEDVQAVAEEVRQPSASLGRAST